MIPARVLLRTDVGDKESRAPSSLLAQQRDAGARLLVLLHHHAFQLGIEKVFHHLFVTRRDFHKIRQHAERAEAMAVHGDFASQQPPHAFRAVGVAGQGFLERLLARQRRGVFAAKRLEVGSAARLFAARLLEG